MVQPHLNLCDKKPKYTHYFLWKLVLKKLTIGNHRVWRNIKCKSHVTSSLFFYTIIYFHSSSLPFTIFLLSLSLSLSAHKDCLDMLPIFLSTFFTVAASNPINIGVSDLKCWQEWNKWKMVIRLPWETKCFGSFSLLIFLHFLLLCHSCPSFILLSPDGIFLPLFFLLHAVSSLLRATSSPAVSQVVTVRVPLFASSFLSKFSTGKEWSWRKKMKKNGAKKE